MQRGWCVGCFALIAFFQTVSAGDAVGAKLHFGRGFTQALEGRRALSVREAPIGRVLRNLQEQTGLCIIFDRRIDPAQRVTLSTGLVPTEDLLRQVAAELPTAGVSVNRAFVYIGPQATAERLRTLCEQNRSIIVDGRRQFEPETYAKLCSSEPLSWPDLQMPRDVVAGLAVRSGVQVVNLDRVPNDLWHAGRLSRMPFAESATLLLCQFDLTFSIDAGSAECTIVPMPERVLQNRRHRVARQYRGEAEQQLAHSFPGLELNWDQSGVRLGATYEQHERIEAWLSGESSLSDD